MLGARLLLNHKMIHRNTRCFLSDNQCDAIMCSTVNLLQKQPYNDVTADKKKRPKVVFMRRHTACSHTSSTMSMTAGVLLGSGIVKLSVTICLTKSMTCLRAAWVLSDTASKGARHTSQKPYTRGSPSRQTKTSCVYVYLRES